ncbi:hypothetical protein LTR09_000956 [Extremus antarcticus]|uniref:Uncharacterized protein n=1 Tax=Extremus antarcticus TaxID=702011 RepID=A0AAJ0GHV2_9PEZI|nr:hypothetical protein LTR09_000956 [Extremus antarcticus]
MSTQQPNNVWQTAAAGRQRQSQSASRTPQNRSGTASPSLQAAPSPSSRPDGGRTLQPVDSVWTQRSSSGNRSNGQPRTDAAQDDGGFNAAEVKTFLAADVGSVVVYKPAEAAGGARQGGAWGSRSNVMANGQPFLAQLAKQVTTLEGGG